MGWLSLTTSTSHLSEQRTMKALNGLLPNIGRQLANGCCFTVNYPIRRLGVGGNAENPKKTESTHNKMTQNGKRLWYCVYRIRARAGTPRAYISPGVRMQVTLEAWYCRLWNSVWVCMYEYHLTQIRTGLGRIAMFLEKAGPQQLLPISGETRTTHHTISRCPRWEAGRRKLEM